VARQLLETGRAACRRRHRGFYRCSLAYQLWSTSKKSALLHFLGSSDLRPVCCRQRRCAAVPAADTSALKSKRVCVVKTLPDPQIRSNLTPDTLGVRAAVVLSFCVAMAVSCHQTRGMIRQHRMLMCGGGALALAAALLFVFRQKVTIPPRPVAPPNHALELSSSGQQRPVSVSLNTAMPMIVGAVCVRCYEGTALPGSVSRCCNQLCCPNEVHYCTHHAHAYVDAYGAQLLSAWPPRRQPVTTPQQPLRVRPRRESLTPASPPSPLGRPSLGRSAMSGA